MSYLKYIALAIGFFLVMKVKIDYTKRNGVQSVESYTKKEQTMLYTGYVLLAASFLFIILFN